MYNIYIGTTISAKETKKAIYMHTTMSNFLSMLLGGTDPNGPNDLCHSNDLGCQLRLINSFHILRILPYKVGERYIWVQNPNSNKITYKITMTSIQNRTKETKTNKTVYFSSLSLTFSAAKQWNKYNKNSTLRSCSI